MIVRRDQWHRCALERRDLNRLMGRRDRHGLVQLAAYLATVARQRRDPAYVTPKPLPT